MHILNRILPFWIRTQLRRAALASIPSMRHLDMPMRLRHMAKRGFQPRTIVDVGAADGEWSRLAASVWPDAKIVGFEPNQHNAAKLEETRRLNPNFAFHMCFLGAKSGQVAYDESGNQTSLYATQSSGRDSAPMRTLDECLDEGLFAQPDLLKMDVQGYELQVLEGGMSVVSKCQAVLSEVNFFRFHPEMPTADDLIAFLKQRGLMIYDVMGIYRMPEDDALGQMDLLFLQAGHALRGERCW